MVKRRCTILTDPEWIEISSNYDAQFVKLINQLPWRERKWDRDRKVWVIIGESRAPAALICKEVYGVVKVSKIGGGSLQSSRGSIDSKKIVERPSRIRTTKQKLDLSKWDRQNLLFDPDPPLEEQARREKISLLPVSR